MVIKLQRSFFTGEPKNLDFSFLGLLVYFGKKVFEHLLQCLDWLFELTYFVICSSGYCSPCLVLGSSKVLVPWTCNFHWPQSMWQDPVFPTTDSWSKFRNLEFTSRI